jgi:hypothetical protein
MIGGANVTKTNVTFIKNIFAEKFGEEMALFSQKDFLLVQIWMITMFF